MSKLPRHIAIVMDGNGRWAKKRFLPRQAGHKSGLSATREVIQLCSDKNIEALTLFAFSSENWKRPEKEVGFLMELFFTALQNEIKRLNKNNVRMRFIGDITAFSQKLQSQIIKSQELTSQNTGLDLYVAVNYGGHWDITHATKQIAEKVRDGSLKPEDIDQNLIKQHVALNDVVEPDLFIRTGGEKRISNFLLWQLAYTELYFTDILWPDFNEQELEKALSDYAARQRRFGHTGEQVEKGEVDA